MDEGLDNAKLFVAFELGRELYNIRAAAPHGGREKAVMDAAKAIKGRGSSKATLYRYIFFYIFVKKYPLFLLCDCLFTDIFKNYKHLCAYLANPAESGLWCDVVKVNIVHQNHGGVFAYTIHPQELEALDTGETDCVDLGYSHPDFVSFDQACVKKKRLLAEVADNVEDQDTCDFVPSPPPSQQQPSQQQPSQQQPSHQQPFQPQTSALSPVSSVVNDVNKLNVNTNPPSNTNPFVHQSTAMETSTDDSNTLAETRA